MSQRLVTVFGPIARPAISPWSLILVGLAMLALGGTSAWAAPPTMTLDLGQTQGQFASRITQIILLVTAISLAPAIVVASTAFVRIVVTLSILRAAMGLHQTPPNMVIVSLALFLTAFVMAPTLERTWSEGLQPLMDETVSVEEGLSGATTPLRDFMETHVNPSHLAAFEAMVAAHNGPEADGENTRPALRALVPAFIVSELSRAFEIGFLLFLPFLVIDLVVAAVLMSMGMMMVPPAVVSLPFKLIFFVLIDGWRLVSEGLALSFLS